jgi:hypothetical protein
MSASVPPHGPCEGWSVYKEIARKKFVKFRPFVKVYHTVPDLEAGLKKLVEAVPCVPGEHVDQGTVPRTLCGRAIFQVTTKADGNRVFIDATSWISASFDSDKCPSTEKAVYRACQLRGFIHKKTQPHHAFGHAMSLISVLAMFASINQFHVPSLGRITGGPPLCLYPYFDVEFVFDESSAAQIKWDECEVLPEIESQRSFTTLRLPDDTRAMIRMFSDTLLTVLRASYDNIVPDTQPHQDVVVCPPLSCFLACRGGKFSAHFIVKGKFLFETLGVVMCEIEQLVTEGGLAARAIDTAVYRLSSDVCSSLRIPLCPTRALDYNGLLYPVNRDGTVSFPSKGRCGFGDVLKASVDTLKGSLICANDIFEYDDELGGKQVIHPQGTWSYFHEEFDVQDEGGSGRFLRDSVCVGSSATIGGVFGCKAFSPHVPVDHTVERRGRKRISKEGMKIIDLYVRTNNAASGRVCHMGTRHSGRQRYLLSIFETGRVVVMCFKGNKSNGKCGGKPKLCRDVVVGASKIQTVFKALWK